MTHKLASSPARADGAQPLSIGRPGDAGLIVDVTVQIHAEDHGVDGVELERRLLEFGFVEGARVEVLHEGAIAQDPIAVRLDDMRVALRRRDARDIWVIFDKAQG